MWEAEKGSVSRSIFKGMKYSGKLETERLDDRWKRGSWMPEQLRENKCCISMATLNHKSERYSWFVTNSLNLGLQGMKIFEDIKSVSLNFYAAEYLLFNKTTFIAEQFLTICTGTFYAVDYYFYFMFIVFIFVFIYYYIY